MLLSDWQKQTGSQGIRCQWSQCGIGGVFFSKYVCCAVFIVSEKNLRWPVRLREENGQWDRIFVNKIKVRSKYVELLVHSTRTAQQLRQTLTHTNIPDTRKTANRCRGSGKHCRWIKNVKMFVTSHWRRNAKHKLISYKINSSICVRTVIIFEFWWKINQNTRGS